MRRRRARCLDDPCSYVLRDEAARSRVAAGRRRPQSEPDKGVWLSRGVRDCVFRTILRGGWVLKSG